MGYIYKITNDINNKLYIGQTTNTIQDRFNKHKYRYKEYIKKNLSNQPLYNAMHKYGLNHFNIELIEECSNDKLNEREKYWINYFNSFNEGYNATRGGDGVVKYDREIISQLLLENILSCEEIANIFNCCTAVIYEIAHNCNINLKSRAAFKKHKDKINKNAKSVEQYDLNNQFIQSFPSILAASEWVVNNGKSHSSAKDSRYPIRRNCNNPQQYKTAYGYIWRYKED